MLIQRFVTAIILVPLVLASLFYFPPVVVISLMSLFVFLAIWEFFGLFNWKYYHRLIFLLLTMLFLLCVLFMPFIALLLKLDITSLEGIWINGLYVVISLGVLWWLVAPYFLWRYSKRGYKKILKPIFLAIIIFIPCLASLVILPPLEILLLLIMVWAADIGAYFTGKFLAGKFWDKHLLAPKISPNKTIEGVGGGVLLSLIATLIFCLIVFPEREDWLTIFALLLLSLVVSLWSVVGDLFESMLKREAGVKDSGKLLPGHGGIYDRIDSLTAAIPIFTLGVLLIDWLI